MINKAILRKEDLTNNPTARVPVCLCLDVSGSMAGSPIEELNKGVKLFYNTILNDEIARYSAEICVVTFGGFKAECLSDFASLQIEPNPPLLRAGGLTPMGEAVNIALGKLAERKNEYKAEGVDYYQPWLVLMTDGSPNGDISQQRKAISEVNRLVNAGKLTVFPIGIGENADMNTLAAFSPKRRPLRLKGLKFQEFFEWLSKSVSKTSQSIPGESVPLDFNKIRDWGKL